MNTKHGNRGLKATRNRNSAGCQFKLGFFLVGLAVLIRLAHPTAAFASEIDNGPAIRCKPRRINRASFKGEALVKRA